MNKAQLNEFNIRYHFLETEIPQIFVSLSSGEDEVFNFILINEGKQFEIRNPMTVPSFIVKMKEEILDQIFVRRVH